MRSAISIPLAPSLAGLIFPGSKANDVHYLFHSCRLSDFLIDCMTVVLSDVSVINRVNSLLTKLAIRVPSTAAWSTILRLVLLRRSSTYISENKSCVKSVMFLVNLRRDRQRLQKQSTKRVKKLERQLRVVVMFQEKSR